MLHQVKALFAVAYLHRINTYHFRGNALIICHRNVKEVSPLCVPYRKLFGKARMKLIPENDASLRQGSSCRAGVEPAVICQRNDSADPRRIWLTTPLAGYCKDRAHLWTCASTYSVAPMRIASYVRTLRSEQARPAKFIGIEAHVPIGGAEFPLPEPSAILFLPSGSTIQCRRFFGVQLRVQSARQ